MIKRKHSYLQLRPDEDASAESLSLNRASTGLLSEITPKQTQITLRGPANGFI
jgi:hypothetical protein